MKTPFGPYLRSLREARNHGLRQFARDVGMQPSNYSNMENGFLQAPGDAVLKRISDALGLADGSAEQSKLFDLAGKSRKEIPVDIREFIKVNPLVPAMLRSMKDKKLSRDQIAALLDDLDKLPESRPQRPQTRRGNPDAQTRFQPALPRAQAGTARRFCRPRCHRPPATHPGLQFEHQTSGVSRRQSRPDIRLRCHSQQQA